VSGYYDYEPLVQPPKPVALIGFVAAGVPRVAHELAALYGLPSVDLNRLIEHAAGASLAQIWMEKGEPAVRIEEARQLQSTIRQQPPGVIALGDGALKNGLNRSLVAETCQLVYIERPLAMSFSRLLRALERSKTAEPMFSLCAPHSPQELVPLFQDREAGYKAAHHTIQADDAHESVVVQLVSQALGWGS